MISTRGRYALRVMIDLAEQDEAAYTPLKEVAERQRISKKYIEAIMTSLSKAGLVDAA
ncbi:MAG: Rrf2 family transcriptional regulator, partial [Firmicutes bacterium]|nr:Rrf2 family transcriptional regulator [Bacillota bacterium]